MAGTLYRALNAEAECIYVGASMNGAARVGQHGDKDWWPEVARVEVTHFSTRDEAFAAEDKILDTAKPKYNRRGGRRALTEAELQERRERREEAEREAADRRASLYRNLGGVSCANCLSCPWQLPRGVLIEDVPCEQCGCKTLTSAPLNSKAEVG